MVNLTLEFYEPRTSLPVPLQVFIFQVAFIFQVPQFYISYTISMSYSE